MIEEKTRELNFLEKRLKRLEILTLHGKSQEHNLIYRLESLKDFEEKEKIKICKEIADRLINEKKKKDDKNKKNSNYIFNIIRSFDDELIRLAIAENRGIITNTVYGDANFEIVEKKEYKKTPYAKQIQLLGFGKWVVREISGENYKIPPSKFQEARKKLIQNFSDQRQKEILGGLKTKISKLTVIYYKAKEKIEEIKIKIKVEKFLERQKADQGLKNHLFDLFKKQEKIKEIKILLPNIAIYLINKSCRDAKDNIIRYFSQISLYYKKEIWMKKWQWTNSKKADIKEMALFVKKIGAIKTHDGGKFTVELFNQWNKSREVIFDTNNKKELTSYSEKKQKSFRQKTKEEMNKTLQGLIENWKIKSNAVNSFLSKVAAINLLYEKPSIRGKIINCNAGMASFVIEEERVNLQNVTSRLKYTVYLLKQEREEAEKILTMFAFNQNEYFLRFVSIDSKNIVINTKQGEKIISLKQKIF